MKKLIFLLFALLLISPVLAEIDKVYGSQNNCVSLRQTCTNCTYVLLTSIQYPNQTVLYINGLMTKIMNDYNYTFCSTDLLGTYTINTCGDIDGSNPCYSPPPYQLIITPTGFEASQSQTNIMIIIIASMFILIILFFIFGLKSDFMPLKITFLSLSVLLIVFSVGYILNMANENLGEFTTLTSGFQPLYIVFIGLLGAGGIGIILYLIVVTFQAFHKTKYGIGE